MQDLFHMDVKMHRQWWARGGGGQLLFDCLILQQTGSHLLGSVVHRSGQSNFEVAICRNGSRHTLWQSETSGEVKLLADYAFCLPPAPPSILKRTSISPCPSLFCALFVKKQTNHARN